MRQIRIVSTSDIHGELNFKLPIGDILTISGDICPVRGSHSPTAQMFWLNDHFLPWCDGLIKDGMYSNIAFIAGNHDFVFKKVVNFPGSNFHFVLPPNVHYLQDSMIELMGVKIYGTPWTPTFGRWAYMRDECALPGYFDNIPEGLDILLSHGPAKGWNDVILQNYKDGSCNTDNLGSNALRDAIRRARPKWTLVGHIHSGLHSVSRVHTDYDDPTKDINIVNVSLLDESYNVAYPPFEFTIIKE